MHCSKKDGYSFKHVAPTQGQGVAVRPQSVLGVAIARFKAPWGEIPVAATSEIDRITVLYWNARRSRRDAIERPHAALSTDGATTDAPLGWNWSDRVGMAASRDTLFVVYKRTGLDFADLNPHLTIDRYVAVDPTGASHDLRLLDSHQVPLLGTPGHELGRSLWCGFDPQTQTLLVLCQVLSRGLQFPPQPSRWQLLLLKVSFDASGSLTVKDTERGTLGLPHASRRALRALLSMRPGEVARRRRHAPSWAGLTRASTSCFRSCGEKDVDRTATRACPSCAPINCRRSGKPDLRCQARR